MKTPDDATPEEEDGLPFEVVRAMGTSPCLFTCDHASRRLPRRLGTLGLSEGELARHITWDIGASRVARVLSDELDACLVLQRFSRLAIDSNRPPGSPDSIIACSDGTVIPGNQGLSAAEAERRVREIFRPYHDAIRGQLDQRARASRRTVLVSLHSFTPTMGGRARPWHLGVLYNRDARVGHRLLAELRRHPELVVGDNEPYAASDDTDYTIVEHGERRGLLHVELEIRQDLIGDRPAQAAWAGRLATCLREVCAAMFPG